MSHDDTRIYHHEAIAGRTEITLSQTASRHLLRVLRLHPGDTVTVFDGYGGEYPAQLLSSERSRPATLALAEKQSIERESTLNLTLAQVMARGEKMDLIIQKAVELGVKRIIPLASQRCNVHLDPRRAEKRQRHWQGIIVSACEQCGRNVLPELEPIRSFDHWLQQDKGTASVLTLSPSAHCTLGEWVASKQHRHDIHLLIGPEGGLSNEEIRNSEAASNCQSIRIGRRILRTETAALATLAALQALLGDFS